MTENNFDFETALIGAEIINNSELGRAGTVWDSMGRAGTLYGSEDEQDDCEPVILKNRIIGTFAPAYLAGESVVIFPELSEIESDKAGQVADLIAQRATQVGA